MSIEPYKKILLEYFPNGFRMGSSIEIRKLKRYLTEEYGSSFTPNDKQLETSVKACGIEYDGKIFIPEAMLNDKAKDKLFAYIDKQFNDGASMIYYEALFHKFNDELLDSRIYNADMLRLYIGNMSGDKYVLGKNYISLKSICEVAPIAEIRNCLKENVLPLRIDELAKMLPHIPVNTIRNILGTNLEFVRNSKGEYFHADSFDVTDEELDDIAEVINDEIDRNGFISGNELYDDIKKKCPYIYEKNSAYSIIGWRDALKYKYRGKFSFEGNVISASDRALSMKDVFSEFGKNRQSFSLDEILQLVDDIGSRVIYFDALYENSARISEDKFVRSDYVVFNVKDTDSAIDRFCSDDYVSINDISNFGILPDASYPWNKYLLENYISFHSRHYKLLHSGYNVNAVVGAVVKRSSEIKDFDELLARAIGESDVALNKGTALSYLVSRGYIGRRSYKNIESVLLNARIIRNRKDN